MRGSCLTLGVLVACGPVTAVIDGDGGPDDVAACEARFEAVPAWVARTTDYAMVRGADDFDANSSTFAHTAGMYSTTTRTYAVDTGEELRSETADGQWLLARQTNLDVLFVVSDASPSIGALRVVDRATGRVRATIENAGVPWAWPAARVRGEHVAVVRCDDQERAFVAVYDLDGREIWARGPVTTCSPWLAGLVDVDPSGERVVVHGGSDRRGAALVDSGSGPVVSLSEHGAPDPDAWIGGGAVLDLAFSPDGQLVGTAGADGVLLLHDADGALVGARELPPTPVNRNVYAQPDTRGAFAWSADGALLARASDAEIVVERTCDGAGVAALPLAADLVAEWGFGSERPATLHFAPDGSALVATYEDAVQGFVVD